MASHLPCKPCRAAPFHSAGRMNPMQASMHSKVLPAWACPTICTTLPLRQLYIWSMTGTPASHVAFGTCLNSANETSHPYKTEQKRVAWNSKATDARYIHRKQRIIDPFMDPESYAMPSSLFLPRVTCMQIQAISKARLLGKNKSNTGLPNTH